jgi:hypothetical protein
VPVTLTIWTSCEQVGAWKSAYSFFDFIVEDSCISANEIRVHSKRALVAETQPNAARHPT